MLLKLPLTIALFFVFAKSYGRFGSMDHRQRAIMSEIFARQQTVNQSSDNCICVMHYQCDRNYNIITTGDGIIDERIGPNDPPSKICPNPNQICCVPPPDYVITTAAPTTPLSTVTTSTASTTKPTPSANVTIPSTIPTVPPSTLPPITVPTLPPATTPTVPPVTTPTVPAVTTPTLPPVTTPTVPPVTTPTLPPVTTPSVPPVTTPTLPPITIPTLPPVTTPTLSPVTIPTVAPVTTSTPPPITIPTVPPVTTPTLPPVTTPSMTVPTTPVTTPTIPTTTAPPTSTTGTVTTPRPPTPSPNAQCGQQFLSAIRETDPFVSSFGEFPWMLALLDSTALSADGTIIRNAFVCGASLLSNNIALTAAHCIKGRNESTLIIRAGEWNTLYVNETLPHQDRALRKIVMHSEFNNRTLINDFALLRLDEPVVFANNVFPICLPNQDAQFANSMCTATGWGRNAFGPAGRFQTKMRKLTIPVVNRTLCQSQLRTTRLTEFFNLHTSFLCAGGQENLDTCTGDGGGPLVCKAADGNSWVQAGIVSWGIGCGQRNVPGVYADVAAFRGWIDATKYSIERSLA